MTGNLTPTHVALPIEQFEMIMKYIISKPYSEAAPLIATVNQTARNIQLAENPSSPMGAAAPEKDEFIDGQ